MRIGLFIFFLVMYTAIGWLSVSFINLEMDPFKWDIGWRALAVMMWIVCTICNGLFNLREE